MPGDSTKRSFGKVELQGGGEEAQHWPDENHAVGNEGRCHCQEAMVLQTATLSIIMTTPAVATPPDRVGGQIVRAPCRWTCNDMALVSTEPNACH
eukprot:360663-Chlamydomonas_euryale.AAC.9